MTRTTMLVLLLLALSSSPDAQESQCPAISRVERDGNGLSTCRCGADLKNVTLTPPRGLELKAACRLRHADGLMAIPSSQSVNLDQYDSRGNRPDGTYYFRGHLRMTGLLRFEPSNGGDLFFQPTVPVEMPKTTIEPSFRTFTLVPEGQHSRYAIDKTVRTMGCAEARAEVLVKEVRVIVNDSEEAGAYPIGIDLLQVSSYKPCKRN